MSTQLFRPYSIEAARLGESLSYVLVFGVDKVNKNPLIRKPKCSYWGNWKCKRSLHLRGSFVEGKLTRMSASYSVTHIDWPLGRMNGPAIQRSVKTLGQLNGIFLDPEAWSSLDPDIPVYTVQWQEPHPPGTPGELSWGSTCLEPGRVGDEYFMTRGHFHAKRHCAEYYCTAQGHGMLLLMDENRNSRVEVMTPGSLHHIPGHTAHRTVNTGETPLLFWACWPGDAGHDYETIARHNFSARILHRNGGPEVCHEASQPVWQTAPKLETAKK